MGVRREVIAHLQRPFHCHAVRERSIQVPEEAAFHHVPVVPLVRTVTQQDCQHRPVFVQPVITAFLNNHNRTPQKEYAQSVTTALLDRATRACVQLGRSTASLFKPRCHLVEHVRRESTAFLAKETPAQVIAQKDGTARGERILPCQRRVAMGGHVSLGTTVLEAPLR